MAKNSKKTEATEFDTEPKKTEFNITADASAQIVLQPEADDLVETAIVAAPAGPVGIVTDASEFDYGDEYAGSQVSLKPEEVIIPMLRIVQESSKVWKERAENGFEGQLGDIYNSITRQFWSGSKGVLVVPIRCEAAVIERLPAPVGTFVGKLSASLDPNKGGDKRVVDAYKNNGKDGWKRLEGRAADGKKVQFVYTDEVHCALLDPEDAVSALNVVVIPFSGTNVFPRKMWWSSMAEVLGSKGTPKYAFRTVLKTVFRKGENGGVDSFKFSPEPYGGNWSKCRLGKSSKETLDRCKEFEMLVDSGALGKADYSDPDAVSETEAEAAAFGGAKAAF